MTLFFLNTIITVAAFPQCSLLCQYKRQLIKASLICWVLSLMQTSIYLRVTKTARAGQPSLFSCHSSGFTVNVIREMKGPHVSANNLIRKQTLIGQATITEHEGMSSENPAGISQPRHAQCDAILQDIPLRVWVLRYKMDKFTTAFALFKVSWLWVDAVLCILLPLDTKSLRTSRQT